MEQENVLSPRDAEGFGVLLMHNLNGLFGSTCCYRCCAPCSYMWDLARDGGKLELLIAQAPYLSRDWLYAEYDRTEEDPPGTSYKPFVREREGRLSRQWLWSRLQGLDNEPCPNHEGEDNAADAPAHDSGGHEGTAEQAPEAA